ncbi:MAG: glycosyltransferase WbuB [Chitinophaga sp.]|nr:glycosyltransferase WbuB [Chitinophaga sp.]
MMNKTIWLVNYYAMPPEHESRLRTIKFAQYLKKLGYNTIVISSSNLHNKEINLIDDDSKFKFANFDGIDFILLNTLKYQSNSLKRFISLFLFHLKLHLLSKKFPKPDFVVHTCLPPFGNISYFTARKFKAKYIAEVLDLWPESFVTFGLIKPSNPLLGLLYYAEKFIYKKADALVFSMEGGIDYLRNKKWLKSQGGPVSDEKVFYINNGVDLADFDYFKSNFKIEDADLENDAFFRVVYIGSIRHANNVQRLVEAAVILQKHTQVKILIYGDGGERQTLIDYCNENNLQNVLFKNKWVEPKYVPYILSKSSLNILNYFPNEIFQYGGSQSKSFQYMASAKPICSNLQMGYCPITKYHLGISKEFNSSAEYANAIEYFISLDPNEYQQLCRNAREAAKYYDYPYLVEQFNQILDPKLN